MGREKFSALDMLSKRSLPERKREAGNYIQGSQRIGADSGKLLHNKKH